MRRVITATVAGTLVLGGMTTVAAPAFAARPAAHAATARAAGQAKAKAARRKTITYRGYQFTVPAGWPVYHLGQHPTTCVRYDVNAVYLGTPGADMQCPAGLIGRGNTISVIPSVTVAAGSGSEVTYQRQQPDATGDSPVRSLHSVHATLTGNAGAHELRVALGAAALTATLVATYGQSPATVERVIGSLRVAPGKTSDGWTGAPAAARQAVAKATAAASAAAAASESATVPAPAAVTASVTGWPGLPAGWPAHVVSPPKKHEKHEKHKKHKKSPPRKAPPRARKTTAHPVSGFDACTAPSLATMRAWRSRYRAIGFYIGGQNTGCADGNVSATWIRDILRLGWGAMPTYVGPQASCTQARGVWEISARHAGAEGREWGQDALKDARKLGIGRGSPLYYDMEAYDTSGHAGCKRAVLAFLGAWDRTVAAAGYQTAVYSSAGSGIAQLQTAAVSRTPGFTAPDAIWIADWDRSRSLTVRNLALSWPLGYRSKQYHGPVWETIGGHRENVDLDYVASPLAR